MSDQKLKQQKLLLDLYTSIKRIENQLDLVATVSSAFIEAESVDLEDTDTYLELSLPIENHVRYLRIMTMNAKDFEREYRQLSPPSSNPIEADTRVLRYVIAIERFDTNNFCLLLRYTHLHSSRRYGTVRETRASTQTYSTFESNG